MLAHIYHLTDYRNVLAIRRDGLLPASMLSDGRKVWWLSSAWSGVSDRRSGKSDFVYCVEDLSAPIVGAFLARAGWRRVVVLTVNMTYISAPVSFEGLEIRVHGKVEPEAIIRAGKVAAARRAAPREAVTFPPGVGQAERGASQVQETSARLTAATRGGEFFPNPKELWKR